MSQTPKSLENTLSHKLLNIYHMANIGKAAKTGKLYITTANGIYIGNLKEMPESYDKSLEESLKESLPKLDLTYLVKKNINDTILDYEKDGEEYRIKDNGSTITLENVNLLVNFKKDTRFYFAETLIFVDQVISFGLMHNDELDELIK